ncbi:MAG: DUF692 domain-containing protein [Pseudomonadota bacterium]|nr:DUF692 domain-containing protein [Betaproteobacteria bacterium]
MKALPTFAVGIGLRQPHYREVFERAPALGFLEVHSENFFLDGGASMHALERARATYPISLHGVGLSLGSADALAQPHLAKLKRLVDRVEPALVSEHLSWSSLGARHFNDLLPMPNTREVLALLTERVDRVQNALKRSILIENVSAYVEFRESDMNDTALLDELARRSGCGILFDVNNLYVNAVNFGFDPIARMAELSPAAIGEMHLAGHTLADGCLIDTHGARVCSAVWALFEEACRRFGPRPTLIEWDTDLPALDVLLDEARTAASVARRAVEVSHA